MREIFYITDTIQTLKHSCITAVTLDQRIRAVFRAIQALCDDFIFNDQLLSVSSGQVKETDAKVKPKKRRTQVPGIEEP